jgi:hypothetical protein
MRVGLSESVKLEISFGFQCDCQSSSSLEVKTIEHNRSTYGEFYGEIKSYLTYWSELGYESLSLHKRFDVLYTYTLGYCFLRLVSGKSSLPLCWALIMS